MKRLTSSYQLQFRNSADELDPSNGGLAQDDGIFGVCEASIFLSQYYCILAAQLRKLNEFDVMKLTAEV